MPTTRSQTSRADRPAGRRGLTLIELLVAISIMVVMMGLAAHMMNLSVDDRRVREAARSVNVFFGSARTEAMVTGRPCGVRLRRAEGDTPDRLYRVVGLDLVEVPPPYAGDTFDAAAKLQVVGLAGYVATVRATFRPADFGDRVVQQHDEIQFNCQGPWYMIHGGIDSTGSGYFDFEGVATDGGGFASDRYLTLEVNLAQGQMLPWPSDGSWSDPVPFQILRQPMVSAASGLQLPAQTVIDLQWSGCEDHRLSSKKPIPDPIMIMFSPNGSIDRVYHDGHAHKAKEPLFFLVGKSERVPGLSAEDGTESTVEDGLANWQDLGNLWISLSPQTGMVRTTEVAPVASGDWTDSREFARGAESKGGR